MDLAPIWRPEAPTWRDPHRPTHLRTQHLLSDRFIPCRCNTPPPSPPQQLHLQPKATACSALCPIWTNPCSGSGRGQKQADSARHKHSPAVHTDPNGTRGQWWSHIFSLTSPLLIHPGCSVLDQRSPVPKTEPPKTPCCPRQAEILLGQLSLWKQHSHKVIFQIIHGTETQGKMTNGGSWKNWL